MTTQDAREKMQAERHDKGKSAPWNDQLHDQFDRELPQIHYRLWLACQFIYFSGLRPAEIMALQVKDLKFGAGLIDLGKHASKDRFPRFVPMPKQLQFILSKEDWKGLTPDTYLFTKKMRPSLEPVSYKNMLFYWNTWVRESHLFIDRALYTLREYGITKMYEGLNKVR